MSNDISLNEINLNAYAISVESLLDLNGQTDVSGIYVTDTISPENFPIKVVYNIGGEDYTINEVEPIEESKGKYYEKTVNGNKVYFVILDETDLYIESELMNSSSIFYAFPTPEDYANDPPIFGTDEAPSSETIYKIVLDPESSPEIFQQAVAEDISGIPLKLSDYSLERVLKAFNNDAVSSPFINNFKVYETITEDIKAQSRTLEDGTTIRPQFKSYNDYLAYKNSLNNRNYVRKNP
jgi:hypothetical protein